MRRLMILGLVAIALLSACSNNNSGYGGAKGSSKAVATLTGSGAAGGYGYGAASAATAAASAPTAAASAATAASSPAASGAVTGVTVMSAAAGAQGTILVDGSGNALYRFDKDTPASSACTAACANIWPPLTVAAGKPTAGPGVGGKLSVLARPDGTQQVTYNGAPLYTFNKDTAPGQVTGDGVGGFHVAKP